MLWQKMHPLSYLQEPEITSAIKNFMHMVMYYSISKKIHSIHINQQPTLYFFSHLDSPFSSRSLWQSSFTIFITDALKRILPSSTHNTHLYHYILNFTDPSCTEAIPKYRTNVTVSDFLPYCSLLNTVYRLHLYCVQSAYFSLSPCFCSMSTYWI
jgi:hypothetical protein